ncbi:hypothetical protein B1no1_23090 [Thermolongibacillus altinsuensis]|nr:hypothetical protein B1no1_23090 [Thermolongibacillus altinsuensis]
MLAAIIVVSEFYTIGIELFFKGKGSKDLRHWQAKNFILSCKRKEPISFQNKEKKGDRLFLSYPID